MKKLHLEAALLATPERMSGQKADRAVLIVGKCFQRVRQRVARRNVRLGGESARHLAHRGGRKPRGVRRRGGVGGGDDSRRRGGEGSFQQVSSVHRRSRSSQHGKATEPARDSRVAAL